MEFSLTSKDSRIPCEVTMDEDNGRYTVRKADTSGEVFNEPTDSLRWVESNWSEHEFVDPLEYTGMVEQLKQRVKDLSKF